MFIAKMITGMFSSIQGDLAKMFGLMT